jgi:hypothetical protein
MHLVKPLSFLRINPALAFLLIPLLLLLGACPVLAQVESAKVLGEVHDSTGAAISGAKVTVTNVETGVAHEVTTDAGGEYVVSELQPGNYALSVQREGFKRAEQPAFKLDVNQVVRIDVALELGMVSEHIEVSAAEPLVESQTSSVGQVIEETQVHELPLNGRDFMQLAYLSPGVNQGEAGAVQQGGIPENQPGQRFNSC